MKPTSPKKPVKEMGPAYNAPIKWRVVFPLDDGSTESAIVEAQTAFLARRAAALKLHRLPIDGIARPLTPDPPKEQDKKK